MEENLRYVDPGGVPGPGGNLSVLESLTFCFIHDLWRCAAAAHVYLWRGAEIIAVVSAVVNTALDLGLLRCLGVTICIGCRAVTLHERGTVGAGGGSRVVAVYLDSPKLTEAFTVVVCTFLYFAG